MKHIKHFKNKELLDLESFKNIMINILDDVQLSGNAEVEYEEDSNMLRCRINDFGRYQLHGMFTGGVTGNDEDDFDKDDLSQFKHWNEYATFDEAKEIADQSIQDEFNNVTVMIKKLESVKRNLSNLKLIFDGVEEEAKSRLEEYPNFGEITIHVNGWHHWVLIVVETKPPHKKFKKEYPSYD